MADSQAFITNVRRATRDFWDAVHDLKALRDQSDALDFVDNLADGTGPNAGIVKADVVAVIGTTLDAVSTLLASGHNTNLSKLL